MKTERPIKEAPVISMPDLEEGSIVFSKTLSSCDTRPVFMEARAAVKSSEFFYIKKKFRKSMRNFIDLTLK